MKADVSKGVGRTFVNGLAVVLPVVLTLAFVWWFGSSLERALGSLLRLVMPDEYYLPGLGICVGVVMIFGVGLATRLWLARRMIQIGTDLLERIPLVNAVFTTVRDVVHFVQSAGDPESMDKVVLVDLGNGLRVVGFVTEGAEFLGGDSESDSESEHVPVYLQMSYQMGGYTVLVPRDRVRPVDASLEEAMRWVLSAGISGNEDQDATEPGVERKG